MNDVGADGHHGQWGFSLRRLNLQVIDVVAKHGGCMIVDSTRRGKSMPDALSKTVPIWIATLNRYLFPELPTYHDLRTPSSFVSSSEHAQIEARLPGFVQDLSSLKIDCEGLRKLLSKPMQSIWITPEDEPTFTPLEVTDTHHNIVLCTASSASSQAMHHSSGYVQGAADDSETWACGLDAQTYWMWGSELLHKPEEDMPSIIRAMVASRMKVASRKPVLVRPTTNIWIANNAAVEENSKDYDIVVQCGTTANSSLADMLGTRYIHLACDTGKNGSRQVRPQLAKLEVLPKLLKEGGNILVTCATGKDLAVGVALAMICRLCDDSGKLDLPSQGFEEVRVLNKALIKQRLSWIMVSMPDAAPSRATLQSVNSYLMG
ncbi:tRNA A64-2'-O-ribosylphosphate transferase [Recurvomyces mirabilis]|uniref:tRNA A64-2'-O-ribosylphosphate transferase n=1 Tax=Recurvomyces mirabilis TaxID=574656 RepID=A0AAE0WR41_9PEZI|nr:tRNA A64-2'-O-ribosylphosphate transferase [Recurvomyces mirabilis]KAK5154867.1 tRNA A64-2'-O-ribosylphosphate transferase [Recurvomyces mirabilis]